MKSFIILSCLVAAVIGETYTTDYDNFNYKEVLENPKLLENYLNCLKNKGPCTAEGKKLKGKITMIISYKILVLLLKQDYIAHRVVGHSEKLKLIYIYIYISKF